MNKNREIEAKTLLSKVVYQNIVNNFSVKENFQQENYYFDTPTSTLKKKKIGLRIRKFTDHAEQTMKVPDRRPIQKKFHEVIEINDSLPLKQANELIAKAKNKEKVYFSGSVGQYLIQNFKVQAHNLYLFTWSKTTRILLNGPKNCELTLDQTEYPDGYCDYELEIENVDPSLIKHVQLQLEKQFNFKQNLQNTNQNKIERASIHHK